MVNPFPEKWKYVLVLPCLFLITSFVSKHAFYIGVVQITMEKTMTVQVKVFSDDLQAILQNDVGYNNVGAINKLCNAQSKHLQAYFQQNLKIHINEQPIELLLSKCEQINDVHLLHFKVNSCPPSWQQVLVTADFFMELFPTQSNMLQLIYNDIETSRRFGKMTLQNSTLQFKFE